MRHLVAHGCVDREALDTCLKTKTRNRLEEILVSVNGTLSMHQREFLNMMLVYLDQIEGHKRQIEASIDAEILKHSVNSLSRCNATTVYFRSKGWKST